MSETVTGAQHNNLQPVMYNTHDCKQRKYRAARSPGVQITVAGSLITVERVDPLGQ